MKIAYSPSAERARKSILDKHDGIEADFERLESLVGLSPDTAAKEVILIDGKRVKVYKKSVKTRLFSGNFLDS